MRGFAAWIMLLLACSVAVAQEPSWDEPPEHKALIAVVVRGAADGGLPIEVSDNAGFVDNIKAMESGPVVKTYAVDPGIYSISFQGSDQLVSLNLKAGAVEIVGVDIGSQGLSSEDFSEPIPALTADSRAVWLGEEVINPPGNALFISNPGSGGTDDPGPMAPPAND